MSRLKLFAASVVVAAGIATATAALADRAAAPVARPAADRHGPTVYQTEAAMRAGVRWDYARFRFTPLQDEWSWRCGTFKVIGHPSKIYQSFGGPQRPIDGDIWYGEILTLAGQQGWEAFDMHDVEKGSEVWFKRVAQ